MYPKSVLSLYVKLYCKRRNTSKKNKMIEGIKSWLTLSKAEKQQFYNKHKEGQIKYKNKLAGYLKKTQPFMKKKKTVRSTENIKAENEPTNDEPTINEARLTDSEVAIALSETVDNIHSADVMNGDNEMFDNRMSCSEEQLSQSEKNCHGDTLNREQNISPVLAEPTPPNIRTARELFEMLNTSNVQTLGTWGSLSSTQKNRYSRAVFSLKHDYITKFKAYLESLPCKELFNYYNTFDF